MQGGVAGQSGVLRVDKRKDPTINSFSFRQLYKTKRISDQLDPKYQSDKITAIAAT